MAPPQPLRWWSAGQLREISHAVEQAVSDWANGWTFGGAAAVNVSSDVAWEDERAAREIWLQLGARELAGAWTCAADALALEAILFGRSGSAPSSAASGSASIASAVTADAIGDLHAALRRGLQLEDGSGSQHPEAAMFRAWSGAVIARLALGAATLRLLLNGAAAARLVRPTAAGERVLARQPLVDAQQACAGSPLSLQVTLEPFDLEVGVLRGLQVGDVVPLPHALDRPLHVSLAGERICQAFVGRRRDAVAVELLRASMPSA